MRPSWQPRIRRWCKRGLALALGVLLYFYVFVLNRPRYTFNYFTLRAETLRDADPVVVAEYHSPEEPPAPLVLTGVVGSSQEMDSKSADEAGTYVEPEHMRREHEQLSRVHIFYYSWWGSPQGSIEKRYVHWNHAVLPHWQDRVNAQFKGIIGKVYNPPEEIGADYYPLNGPYSCSDQETLERHAKEIRDSGAGVAVLSWYPPGKSDSNGIPELVDQLVPRLLDTFDKYGLKLAFHIEPYPDRTAESVWSDAEYITLRYGAHRGLAKVNGKPLLYVYDSYLIPIEQWRQVARDKTMTINKNACILGLVVESRHLDEVISSEGFFDGVFTYFAADGFVWGSTRTSWKDLVKRAHSHGLLTSISVGPGYMDTRIRPWNGMNTRPRKAGEYYRDSFRAATQAMPSFLSITSYNEWHEGTQIEPAAKKEGYEDYQDAAVTIDSEDVSHAYLELTARLVKEYFADSKT